MPTDTYWGQISSCWMSKPRINGSSGRQPKHRWSESTDKAGLEPCVCSEVLPACLPPSPRLLPPRIFGQVRELSGHYHCRFRVFRSLGPCIRGTSEHHRRSPRPVCTRLSPFELHQQFTHSHTPVVQTTLLCDWDLTQRLQSQEKMEEESGGTIVGPYAPVDLAGRTPLGCSNRRRLPADVRTSKAVWSASLGVDPFKKKAVHEVINKP